MLAANRAACICSFGDMHECACHYDDISTQRISTQRIPITTAPLSASATHAIDTLAALATELLFEHCSRSMPTLSRAAHAVPLRARVWGTKDILETKERTPAHRLLSLPAPAAVCYLTAGQLARLRYQGWPRAHMLISRDAGGHELGQ